MQYKLNISIDDVSPHPRSSVKVIEQCNRIIERFPDAKFTLFVPVSYWRTMKPEVASNRPFQINLYPDFCDTIKSLSKKNFEIGYHGFHHGIPGKTDNDEMRNLTSSQCNELLTGMKKIVELSGLDFAPVLRPPSWRMSPECFDPCKDHGIKVLALHPGPYGGLDYGGKDKDFEHVVYYTACPPFQPLELCEKIEVVYHACDWDKNYLNKSLADDLISFIERNEKDIDFCFMEEMV